MSQSGRMFRWEVSRELCAFTKMCQGCEVGMPGKKSSLLRTIMRGLFRGNWVWKSICGVCDMQEMALMEK